MCTACRATCEFCSSGVLSDGSSVSCDDRPQSSCTSYMNPLWSNDTVPPLRRYGFCADRLAGTPEMPATSTDRGKWKGDATRGLVFETEDDARAGGHNSGGRGSLHSAPDRRSGALGWRAVKRCLANKTVVFVGDSNCATSTLRSATTSTLGVGTRGPGPVSQNVDLACATRTATPTSLSMERW